MIISSIIAASTLATAVLLVVVLKELSDIYKRLANIDASSERLHDMIWGALGTPDIPGHPPPTIVKMEEQVAAGKIYTPDGWGEEEGEET